MNISQDHKKIFIGIPKTGSSTISRMLTHDYNWSQVGKHGRIKNKHAPTSFKFCFVRNPWNRAVGWYWYRQNRSALGSRGRTKGREFKEWLMNPTTGAYAAFGYGMYFNQSRWLRDEDGNFCMDFIGRFENLHDDFINACVKMGLEPPGEMRHTNASHPQLRKHYTEYYDDESIEFVRHKSKEDVVTFGYEFEK